MKSDVWSQRIITFVTNVEIFWIFDFAIHMSPPALQWEEHHQY